MSKHHTSQSKVFQDIRKMSKEELQDFYGITINDDGSVIDSAENQQFKSLDDWAAFIAELESADNCGSFEKIGGKHYFDDEY